MQRRTGPHLAPRPSTRISDSTHPPAGPVGAGGDARSDRLEPPREVGGRKGRGEAIRDIRVAARGCDADYDCRWPRRGLVGLLLNGCAEGRVVRGIGGRSADHSRRAKDISSNSILVRHHDFDIDQIARLDRVPQQAPARLDAIRAQWQIPRNRHAPRNGVHRTGGDMSKRTPLCVEKIKLDASPPIRPTRARVRWRGALVAASREPPARSRRPGLRRCSRLRCDLGRRSA